MRRVLLGVLSAAAVATACGALSAQQGGFGSHGGGGHNGGNKNGRGTFRKIIKPGHGVIDRPVDKMSVNFGGNGGSGTVTVLAGGEKFTIQITKWKAEPRLKKYIFWVGAVSGHPESKGQGEARLKGSGFIELTVRGTLGDDRYLIAYRWRQPEKNGS